MKKSTFKKGVWLLLSVIMLVPIMACGGSNNSGGSTAPDRGNSGANDSGGKLDPVTLKIMLFGEKPKDMDKILAKFEEQTKDTLNTKLNIEWNSNNDHKQKLKLRMAAGETVDAAFDAPWGNLYQHVSQGFYQELDKYFNNDEYPGLKQAFSEEFLESNKINGHVYAIPFTQYYNDIRIVLIRKDLREKYGMEPIQSYEELEAYLDKVKESEANMTPLVLTGRRGFQLMFAKDERQDNLVGITGVPFKVVLSEDGKKVLNAITLGDPASMYENFPAPLNDPEYVWYEQMEKFSEWNQKYVQKDALSEQDATVLFVSGKGAATEGTISSIASVRDRLKSAVPGADVEPFVISDRVRNMEKEAMGVTYKAWNYLVIPATTKNTDRMMKFIDWIFQSQENHDLFELGIEGEHWVKDGDNKYKMTDKTTNYIFPAYELTWNPLMSRINGDNDEETLKYLEYSAQEDSYYRLPLSGFVFDSEPVKTEIAKISPKNTEYDQITKLGADPDWRTYTEKYYKEVKALGLETLRAEVVKQVQAYIDAGGK